MKYALSGTVALALHHDFSLISLHCNFIAFTSTPQFTPNYLHFTSLHYIFYDLHHTFTSPDVSLS
jgi:hypothetical protein